MAKHMWRSALALLVASAITIIPVFTVQAENAWLGKVVPRGAAELNQTRLVAEATLFAGDTVATPAEGLAVILLPRGGQIHVGPASTVKVESAAAGVLAGLDRGTVLARSAPGQRVLVAAANLLVTPQSPEALYQVALTDNGAMVAAERGAVSVAAANRTVTVPAGQAMRFEVAEGPQAPAGAGAGAGMSTATATGIAVAISVGIAVPVGWIVSNKLADDARQEGCEEAILSVSAALSTAACS